MSHNTDYNIGIGGTLRNSSQTMPTSSLEQMIKMRTLFNPPPPPPPPHTLTAPPSPLASHLLTLSSPSQLGSQWVQPFIYAGQCGGVTPGDLQRALQHHPDWEAASVSNSISRRSLPSGQSHLCCARVLLWWDGCRWVCCHYLDCTYSGRKSHPYERTKSQNSSRRKNWTSCSPGYVYVVAPHSTCLHPPPRPPPQKKTPRGFFFGGGGGGGGGMCKASVSILCIRLCVCAHTHNCMHKINTDIFLWVWAGATWDQTRTLTTFGPCEVGHE